MSVNCVLNVDLYPNQEIINIVWLPGTTTRRNLSHVVFLDQNFMRNKNIFGKKPNPEPTPEKGVLYGGQMLIYEHFEKRPNNVEMHIKWIVGSY